MTRRQFVAAVSASTLMAAGAPELKDIGRKRNIVFTFSDEHRYQSMVCSEMPELRTPNMSRLAAEGVTFTHCISNYPVCSPYRGMLMTGRWPYQNGVIDNGIPPKDAQMRLGKVFQQAGYRTGYIGKWHLGGMRAESFGFDHSLVWTHDNVHWDRSKYHPLDAPPVCPKGYNATLMTNQAMDFMTENKNRPFFLMVSWNPPHSNFLDAPEEKKALYSPGSLQWRENVPQPVRDGLMKDKEIWSQSTWPYYQGYHAHISAIDDEIGRILQRLEELNLSEDTIVIYTSDHGSMMGSHGLGGKRQPYEESIRVPFFVRNPQLPMRGIKKDALFGTCDIMPTLCGLAGLQVPEQCVGRDLSPVLLSGADVADEPQLLMHIRKKNASGGEDHPAPLFRGIRTARYTYAVREEGPWLLLDNQEDPYQRTNRINDAALASVRKELHGLLAEQLKRVNDSFVVKG